MKKKILSVILCATLAFASAVSANAAESDEKKFVALTTECYIPNNTVKMFTYNMDPQHSGRVTYKSDGTSVELYFKDAVSSPQSATLKAGVKYDQWFWLGGNGGSGGSLYSFDSTGGRYRKIRIKLSDFSDYFNEDGSHTKSFFDSEPFDYKFKYQNDAEGNYYNSLLVIKSGAAHNAVVPDENGEVEIYISLNPNHYTSYYTNFKSSFGGGGGTMGGSLRGATFGDINQSGYVDVNDVTQIQLILSGNATLNKISEFYSDINLDGIHDVKDVTALQLALAE